MAIRRVGLCVALGATVVSCGAAYGQYAMVVDSGNDRIVLLDAQNGSVVDANFITLGSRSQTPIEAIEVNGEVWVSDQVADVIFRYDRRGNFLGEVGTGRLDNIRGMQLVGNTLWVAQDGSQGDGIVSIDVTTRVVGSTVNGSTGTGYFDVQRVGNELLVSNSATADSIDRYSLTGAFLGTLVSSDGVNSFDFPQQIAVLANGNIAVGGFSPPAGVYEIALNGSVVGLVAGQDAGPRGVFQLGNGTLLWTNGSIIGTGASVATQTVILGGGQYRYVTATALPTPGAAGVLALGGVLAMRRRRAR